MLNWDKFMHLKAMDHWKSRKYGITTALTFTINIPDDLRPVTTGATAEAWLVYTYRWATTRG